MKLDRKEILSALETITIAGEGKNMVESGAVQNVLTFGNEVVVELVISSPAMHIKKRAEDDIRKLIHEKFSPEAVVKVNIKVETPTQNPNQIKGKSIYTYLIMPIQRIPRYILLLKVLPLLHSSLSPFFSCPSFALPHSSPSFHSFPHSF